MHGDPSNLCARGTCRVRSRHTLAWLVALVAAPALLLAACGDTDDDAGGSSGDCRVAEDGEVTIVAEDLEWDVDCLEAPAGEPLRIVVDNRDDGVAHNLNVKDTDFATDLENGPVTQELEVTLDEGSYRFVCDIHPNMVGTLQVVAANQG